MCKVLIKEIKRETVKQGSGQNGKPWKLFLFDAIVDVDSTGTFAERTVKTFDEKTAEAIRAGAGHTFESKRQGECAPFSYLVEPERRQHGGGAGRNSAPAKNPRMVAFEEANRLVVAGLGSGLYESPEAAADAVLAMAARFVAFLEA